jgi:large subunit ribosomal protein L24
MARADVHQRAPRVPDIRKGDQVVVLAGKEAGKRGTVERVVRNPQGYKKTIAKYGSNWRKASPLAGTAVIIEGLNIAKRHTKPRPKSGRTERQPRIQQGGILDVPQPILASKVMVICPHCGEATRIKHGVGGDGRSIRVCGNCGEPVTREEKKS